MLGVSFFTVRHRQHVLPVDPTAVHNAVCRYQHVPVRYQSCCAAAKMFAVPGICLWIVFAAIITWFSAFCCFPSGVLCPKVIGNKDIDQPRILVLSNFTSSFYVVTASTIGQSTLTPTFKMALRQKFPKIQLMQSFLKIRMQADSQKKLRQLY